MQHVFHKTVLQHDEGAISMANYGEPNSNNSQFFIVSVSSNNLDGTNVVVGKVIRGLSIVSDMELVTSDDGKPQEVSLTSVIENSIKKWKPLFRT